MLKHPVTLTQAAVPIRVCYLVPFDATTAMLTAIFKECYERWGGRDSLIVPVCDNVIGDAYWKWVRALDPDVVYAYAAIDDELLRRIDREWMPSIFKLHLNRSDHLDFTPHHGVEALKTLSVLPTLANQDRIGPQRRLALLSRFINWTPDTLLADSFGINPFGPGTTQVVAVRKDADIYAVGQRGEAYYRETAEREFESSTEVLNVMAERAYDRMTMAQLSGSGYDGLHYFSESAWRGSFSVVVGDTPTDRIAFWNGRVGFDDWHRRHIIAIHLSEEEARNTELLAALKKFIISANPWTSNGAHFVTIRSSSTSDDLLQSIVDAFRPHLNATSERFADANACAPQDITQPVFMRHGSPERFTDGFVRFAPMVPAHLVGPHAPSAFLSGGGWSVEVSVIREAGGSFEAANRELRYPRRWQAVRAIAGGAIAKTSVTGGLKIVVAGENKPQVLRFSDDDAAYIARLFLEAHYLWNDDPRIRLAQAKIRPRISEAGRHLLGFLNRLGNIQSAHHVLEDEFWKSVFNQMAVPRAMSDDATRSALADRIGRVLQRKRITGIETPEELEALAEVFAGLAPTIPMLSASRQFRWFVSEYKKTNGALRLKASSTDVAAWEEAVVAKVREELEYRCDEGVLIQGYSWTCQHCLHANWMTVDSAKKTMPCAVCGWETSISADFEWTFRLDEYIANGIYMGGLRGLVWALGKLAFFPRYSFEFSPPLDVFEGDDHITDADIACVRDGLFIVGEVKESGRNVNDSVGDTLVKIARKLVPDVVIIACMEDAAFNKVRKQVDRVRAELNDPLIDVLGFTLNNEYGIPGGIIPHIVEVPYVSPSSPQPSVDDWSI